MHRSSPLAHKLPWLYLGLPLLLYLAPRTARGAHTLPFLYSRAPSARPSPPRGLLGGSHAVLSAPALTYRLQLYDSGLFRDSLELRLGPHSRRSPLCKGDFGRTHHTNFSRALARTPHGHTASQRTLHRTAPHHTSTPPPCLRVPCSTRVTATHVQHRLRAQFPTCRLL